MSRLTAVLAFTIASAVPLHSAWAQESFSEEKAAVQDEAVLAICLKLLAEYPMLEFVAAEDPELLVYLALSLLDAPAERTAAHEAAHVIQQSASQLRTAAHELTHVIQQSGGQMRTAAHELTHVVQQSGTQMRAVAHEAAHVIQQTRTAAHEAAHVVQQSAGGEKLLAHEAAHVVQQSPAVEAVLQTAKSRHDAMMAAIQNTR